MEGFDILDVPITQPKRKMGSYSYTIYGRPKFGKSGFASKFPNPLFFGFETGQNALTVRLIPVTDWKHFKSLTAQLVKAKQDGKEIPYRNFVIDTADVAWKYCTTYVCKKNGWTHPSDAEWGKGWQAVADEWFFEMDNLSKLGSADDPITPIYITHHEEKEFKPKGKDKYDKIIPSVPKGARAVIVDKVDFIIFCDVEVKKHDDGTLEEIRTMYFRDKGEFEAGSRLQYFPESLPFGDNAQVAFSNFEKAFNEAILKEFGAEGSAPPKAEKADKKKEDKSEKKKEDKSAPPVPPKEETSHKVEKAETPTPPKKETPPKAEDVGSIEEVKKELDALIMELYKSGKLSPVEIVDTLKLNAGVEKSSAIDTIEKAKATLSAFKSQQ